MKIIPKTKKDFAWVSCGPQEIKNIIDEHLSKAQKDIDDIKKIPKKDRTFQNTIIAIENAGLPEMKTNSIALLSYVSPKKEIREAASKALIELSKRQIDIAHDPDLYQSVKDYRPKNLGVAEKRVYKDVLRGFEQMGFHLSAQKQKELKKIKKEIAKLGHDAEIEINNARVTIACTKDELSGLDDDYIDRLQKNKKTGKFIVSSDYPEFMPFIKNVSNAKKRKELIDKASRRGGIKNIKRLQRLLILRDQQAKLLGYKNHPEFVLEERLAKNQEILQRFLVESLSMIENPMTDFVQQLIKQKGSKLFYYDYAFEKNIFIKKNFSIDEDKIKEYFELSHVLQSIFELMQILFGVTFKRNNDIPLWHEDVFMYDIYEDGKKIAHLAFDLFPRDGKYKHACHWSMAHGASNEEQSAYESPFSVIISNSSKPQKGKPSLLSFWDVEALYHEFGHACHALLTRARYRSQSGTDVQLDFVETPSQLIEMWPTDPVYLKSISSHYKTKEPLEDAVIERIRAYRKTDKLDEIQGILVKALYDLSIHQNPKASVLAVRKKMFPKYNKGIEQSKVSLFPSSFGHIYEGYDVGYYSYAWTIIYAYDIFSRFKKEGIMNKKVGMELRRKILEKGDSEDAMKLMTDFLGRKPNNKAFLKALK